MIKLYAEDENGKRLELKEIETVGSASDVLLFFCTRRLSFEESKRTGEMLSEKTGKTCILLDGTFNRVLGV